MKRIKIILLILTVLVVSSIIYGFSVTGSPLDARNKKFDETRVNNLRELMYSINNYYSTNYKLPLSLSELSLPTYLKYQPLDPETGIPYAYKTTGQNTYELCATFTTDTSTYKKNDSSIMYRPVMPDSANPTFDHGTGYTCFNLSTPVNDYIYPRPLPAISPEIFEPVVSN